jgi:FdhD protein
MTRVTDTVEETPWWLDVNSTPVAEGTATPERIETLAAGRLLADGYVTGPADILALNVVFDPPGCVGVRVRIAPDLFEAGEALRSHRRAQRCGARHYLDCGTRPLLGPRTARTRLPEDFSGLFRDLFANAERHQRTGGVHTASLSDGIDLLYQVEDVGRHNAVDKTIGWALLEGADASRLGLLLSARVSAEIAVKAARAGLAWVASRSIPTDLAVEIARAAALPIIARAPGKDARVFAGGVGALDRSEEPPPPAAAG